MYNIMDKTANHDTEMNVENELFGILYWNLNGQNRGKLLFENK